MYYFKVIQAKGDVLFESLLNDYMADRPKTHELVDIKFSVIGDVWRALITLKVEK